jgi:hypothetical protein
MKVIMIHAPIDLSSVKYVPVPLGKKVGWQQKNYPCRELNIGRPIHTVFTYWPSLHF